MIEGYTKQFEQLVESYVNLKAYQNSFPILHSKIKEWMTERMLIFVDIC